MIKNRNIITRILAINLIIVFAIFSMQYVLANLEEEEETISTKEIEETIESANISNGQPKLNSRIGLIYDRTSGRILYEKNGNKQTPMASTTKIMTAIVVVENSNLKDIVTIGTKAAGTGGSRLGLKKNDKITVKDLLYGLMLRSGNDTAIALAIHVGGSVEGFAELMNKKAEELGLCNSHFLVPHGLDVQEHYTTAYELAKIADYALNIKEIKEIVGAKIYNVSINGKTRTITNTNELLGSLNGVYGVKTGFTNGAGRCLVTSCKRGDLDIITVILGADTKRIRTLDSISLIEYAYKNYQMIDIKTKIEEEFNKWKEINEKRIKINKGNNNELELKLEKLKFKKIAVKKTQTDNINIEINNLFYLESPVQKESIIGNAKIKIGEEVIQVLNIYNINEISKKGISDYILEFLKIAT